MSFLRPDAGDQLNGLLGSEGVHGDGGVRRGGDRSKGMGVTERTGLYDVSFQRENGILSPTVLYSYHPYGLHSGDAEIRKPQGRVVHLVRNVYIVLCGDREGEEE